MNRAEDPLPLFLTDPLTHRVPIDVGSRNVDKLRAPARLWLSPEQAKMTKGPLVTALQKALADDAAAARVAATLTPIERIVAAVYRRYGGTVNGELIQIELMARGILEIITEHINEYYSKSRWKRNPVKDLAEKWVLLPADGANAYDDYYSYSYGYSGNDAGQPFKHYGLQTRIAARIEPAGPAAWSIPPAVRPPDEVTRRSTAEVALDLSRVLAFLASKDGVKVRKDGVVALPSLRALDKAVPADDGTEFTPPDVHALYFEILRSCGAIRVEENTAVVDRDGAARASDLSDYRQAHAWAHAWLTMHRWHDGQGVPESYDMEDKKDRIPLARRVLAWGLGGLARAGHHWYELAPFVTALSDLQKHTHIHLPTPNVSWKLGEKQPPRDRYARTGSDNRQWYANALMISLVTLGLAERGRSGRGTNATYLFRLTDVGRAVFGAPEVAPASRPESSPFLVVQPNFDVLAYVEQADAASGALLGRIAEVTSKAAGPVQTLRLTQTSVYQGLEGGLDHARIVAFLERQTRGTLPPNVVRSLADWTGRRESLILRSGVRLLGFATSADRDAALKKQPGTACGERFIVAPAATTTRGTSVHALISDHEGPKLRRGMRIDEHGAITIGGQLDIVQRSRLRRIASVNTKGWRLTGDSVRGAHAAGMKPAQLHRWLAEHLEKPAPRLIDEAIDAWMGKTRLLGLDSAILLHVPHLSVFEAITASTRLQPFLLGSPGRHWLIVPHDSRDALAAALKELGFTVDRHLPTAAEIAAIPPETPAETIKPAKGKPGRKPGRRY